MKLLYKFMWFGYIKGGLYKKSNLSHPILLKIFFRHWDFTEMIIIQNSEYLIQTSHVTHSQIRHKNWKCIDFMYSVNHWISVILLQKHQNVQLSSPMFQLDRIVTIFDKNCKMLKLQLSSYRWLYSRRIFLSVIQW